jgi:hypothetical protein
MRVNFYLCGDEARDQVSKALFDGCPEDKELISGFEYKPADVAVVFGVFKRKVKSSYPRGAVIAKHKEAGSTLVILETGYVNRGDGWGNHFSAGLNGLNGRADFRNKNSPADRFEKLGVDVVPWKSSGEHILLCGQVPWDASVDHIEIYPWLIGVVAKLQEMTTRKIVFRPHPLGPVAPIGGTEYSKRYLHEDLAHAHACVTFNSNSAVEAAIAGVPVFAFDAGSMALPVANTDLSDIETPKTPDRAQWLNDLAYTQWTPEEMRSGATWAHLFR